jgi:hypothetical protein
MGAVLPDDAPGPSREALALLEGDALETLLSVKQTTLWRWAQSVPEGELGRKAAMEALGYPARTVEAIIKSWWE